MEPTLLLLALALSACCRGAAGDTVTVTNGQEFGAALAAAGQPGPPLTLLLATNISMVDVPSARPARIARNLTIQSNGAPERAELNLDNLYDAWKLDRDAYVTLRNITLSNLATRPTSAEGPPPANVSGARCAGWLRWLRWYGSAGQQDRARAARLCGAAAPGVCSSGFHA